MSISHKIVQVGVKMANVRTGEYLDMCMSYAKCHPWEQIYYDCKSKVVCTPWICTFEDALFFVEKRREYLINHLDSVHVRAESDAENSNEVDLPLAEAAWLERFPLCRSEPVLQIGQRPVAVSDFDSY